MLNKVRDQNSHTGWFHLYDIQEEEPMYADRIRRQLVLGQGQLTSDVSLLLTTCVAQADEKAQANSLHT